ncbi:MAG: PAS domain S-box protein [Desulfobaccales bacterium]
MSTRILLADEYRIFRQELRALLEKERDFTVVAEADTWKAAVKLASEVKPDVVVLDLALARLQGLTPIHQLTAAVRSAKVIGLSMHTDRRFVLEVLKAGAFGFVLKENTFEELATAVRAVKAHKTFISPSLFSTVIQDYIDLLREREARFRTIFESSSIGIALMDGESQIVESNPALQELLGCSRDDLCNKEFFEFLKLEEVDGCKAFFKDLVVENRGPYRVEKEYRRQDGRLSWGRLSVSPFRGTGGEGPVAIGMFEDINDQKQAEARIRHYQEKLRSLGQELSPTEEGEPRRPAAEISQQRMAEEMLQESEESYCHLLELFPEALVIHSEGRIVYVNPAGLRLFGAESPTPIIGKSILDLVHPDYRENMQDRSSLVEKGLETIPLQEKKFLRLDGKVLDAEIVGIPIIYLRKPAALIIVKDISERIKNENALRESQRRLANFIDFLPDATLVIDREGKVIAWNKAIEEMTGVKAENMLGKDNYQYALPFYGERRPILIDLAFKPQEEIAKYPEVKREGLSLSAETFFPMVRGSEAYLYEKASILRDSKGNIIGAIESIRDITDRLKAEAERLRFSKIKSLGTLTNGIAQDFNTILVAIQNNIGLAMSDGKLEPKVRDRLARAEQDCQRAQDLSRRLLTFAQGGSANKKPVAISKLLEESAMLTLSGSKSRCEFSIPDDLWSVEADEGQIKQVIGNLLANADQAMPAGGVIKIRAENILAEGEPDLPISKGRYAKLTFADEGGGISPKHLDKIFDPYFSDNQKGSGLGLAIAYAIIKNHSGYIKVESQVGVGTTFHIYLPAMETGTPAVEPETAKPAMN